jgi:hypothetical protein
VTVRTAMNIVLGCLLLWMQAMMALSPHTVTEAAPCRCCACGSQACSVPQNVPAPTPSPITTQRVSSETESVAVRAPATAQLESRVNDTFFVPTTIASIPPASQPLYQRHCALLI